MRALAALVFAVLCAVTPWPASAQGRDSAYTVAGVPAEATAANSAQAQTQALAAAQRIGFERLVRRIGVDADVQRVGVPQIAGPQLENLISSVDIENERRSSTRYLARVTLRFNANGVRAALRQAGIGIVDTRTSPVLIVPQAPGAAPETAAAWQEAWAQGGFNEELVPLAVAAAPPEGAPDWAAVEGQAQAAAAATAVFATLRVSGQTATATLIEVGPNNVRRDRGPVTTRVTGELRTALSDLANQASLRLSSEWKSRAASPGGGRGRISASALYQEEREWQQIKSALEAAASTLISEIRIEAVGRQGALVSFSFVGDQGQLVTELRRNGVSLENADIGPVLRVARR